MARFWYAFLTISTAGMFVTVEGSYSTSTTGYVDIQTVINELKKDPCHNGQKTDLCSAEVDNFHYDQNNANVSKLCSQMLAIMQCLVDKCEDKANIYDGFYVNFMKSYCQLKAAEIKIYLDRLSCTQSSHAQTCDVKRNALSKALVSQSSPYDICNKARDYVICFRANCDIDNSFSVYLDNISQTCSDTSGADFVQGTLMVLLAAFITCLLLM